MGGNIEKSAEFVQRINDKITKNVEDITDVRTFYDDEDMEVGVICFGSVARSAGSAVEMARAEGMKVGWMKMNTIWPVPERQLREFCAKCKKVLVPEMNIGKYVREIQRVGGYDKVVGASILGGALFTPEQILEKIKEVR